MQKDNNRLDRTFSLSNKLVFVSISVKCYKIQVFHLVKKGVVGTRHITISNLGIPLTKESTYNFVPLRPLGQPVALSVKETLGISTIDYGTRNVRGITCFLVRGTNETSQVPYKGLHAWGLRLRKIRAITCPFLNPYARMEIFIVHC